MTAPLIIELCLAGIDITTLEHTTGPYPLDGFNIWPALTGTASGFNISSHSADSAVASSTMGVGEWAQSAVSGLKVQ
jgi:hypothetical protein